METLLLSDESFGSFSRSELDQNPEAIFDILTRQTMETRYGSLSASDSIQTGSSSHSEATFANDDEFETYVQQFPIDDSIAECFAFTSDSDSATSTTQFLSGGKRPPITNRYQKLKSRLGWKSGSEISLLEDESKSSESKRSKKAGGVFSKRHKWRTPIKKSVLFCDQSGDHTDDVIDAVRPRMTNEVPDAMTFGHVTHNSEDSLSESPFTSFTDTISNKDETEPRGDNRSELQLLQKSRLPTVSGKPADLGHRQQADYANIELTDDSVVDCFKDILSGDSTTVLKKIDTLASGDVMKLRDVKGNTLLHRCVTAGNAEAVKRVMERCPDMASDLNSDNVTAMELAAQTGEVACLKVALERQPKRKVIGTSPINRLINISAAHGQAECLELLLTYVSRDQNGACVLTGDVRGNTAAHLVAKQGNVKCLHALVKTGVDVSTENLMRQRPLHVAHQNRNAECFEYLLVLDVCGQLLKYIRIRDCRNTRLADQVSGMRSVLDNVTTYIRRYKGLLGDTREALTDNKDGILKTLGKLHEDMEQFIKHTSLDTGAKRKEARDKLDELRGEIERLEDTFEFSPMDELDGALTRLIASVNDVMADESAETEAPDREIMIDSVADDKLSTVLSNLVKDFHNETEAENWDTGHLIEKYAGEIITIQKSPAHHSNKTAESSNDIKPDKAAKDSSEHRLDDKIEPTYTNTASRPLRNSAGASLNPNGNSLAGGHTTMSKMHEELLRAQEEDVETGATSNNASDNTNGISTAKNNLIIINKFRDIPVDTSSASDNSVTGSFSIKNELTLDERMDLLIAGERAERNYSNAEGNSTESDTIIQVSGNERINNSYCDTPSNFSNTLTSITSVTDSSSNATHPFKYSSTDSYTDDVTSESVSYWWDMLGDTKQHPGSKERFDDVYDSHVKLHLGDENKTSGELRRDRLLNHLRSVQRTRYPSNELRERIRTSTGETIGGFETQAVATPGPDGDRLVVNVNGALRIRDNTSVKPVPQARTTKKGKPRLFSLEDAIDSREMTQTKFLESYDRSRGPTSPPFVTTWEDTSFTDEDEEEMTDGRPWYDMSDDDTSLVPSWRSDDGDTVGSRTPELL